MLHMSLAGCSGVRNAHAHTRTQWDCTRLKSDNHIGLDKIAEPNEFFISLTATHQPTIRVHERLVQFIIII